MTKLMPETYISSDSLQGPTTQQKIGIIRSIEVVFLTTCPREVRLLLLLAMSAPLEAS